MTVRTVSDPRAGLRPVERPARRSPDGTQATQGYADAEGAGAGKQRSGRSRAGSDRVPTNLSLPRDLVAELDAVAGPRNRSAFVEGAVRKALKRERLRIAIERTAGALRAEDYPHWATSEAVVRWVQELRAEETDPGPEPEED